MNARKKPQILRNSRQFRIVYDQGKRYHTPFFSAFILKTETSHQRFGITVTKKVGNAVLRNRCKRRLREIVRRYLAEHDHRNQIANNRIDKQCSDQIGYDLVINAKAALATVDFQELEAAFIRVMEKFTNSPRQTE